ncbi:MAG: hypothetical protein RR538_09245 [Erysipelotrichaceae bacterium]
MKKQVIISCLFCMLLSSLYLAPIEAKTNDPVPNICTNEKFINMDDVINVEVIGGEIYIDVFTELDSSRPVPYDIGKCPQSIKYVTKKLSKAELVKLKNELATQEAITDGIFSLMFGGGIATSLVIGTLTAATKNMTLAAIEKALDGPNKNSYTLTSKFQCEESWLGNRGTVHRYRLISVKVS